MIIVVMPARFGKAHVPSNPVRCQRCGADCWISKRARLGLGDAPLCVVCAMAMVHPGDTIDTAPWVAADIEEHGR